MDGEERSRIAAELRQKTSSEAADWLISTYSAGGESRGEAYNLLARRSWARVDQYRLARHYLARIPFATPKPYAVLLSIMSLPVFLTVVEEMMPTEASKLDLLLYYLERELLKAIKSERHEALAGEFIRSLRARAEEAK